MTKLVGMEKAEKPKWNKDGYKIKKEKEEAEEEGGEGEKGR